MSTGDSMKCVVFLTCSQLFQYARVDLPYHHGRRQAGDCSGLIITQEDTGAFPDRRISRTIKMGKRECRSLITVRCIFVYFS